MSQELTPVVPVTRTLGVVKWFDSRGGFGFITVLPGEIMEKKDIFVHYSSLNVTQSQYKYLVLGEYVEFTLTPAENEKYEFYAKDVSGIRGGSLMCESRRLSTSDTGDAHSTKKPPAMNADDDGFVPVVNRRRHPVGNYPKPVAARLRRPGHSVV